MMTDFYEEEARWYTRRPTRTCHLHTYTDTGTVVVRSAALTTYETGLIADPCMILAVILRSADICRIQAAVGNWLLYIDMILPWNTRLPLQLQWEEYWKYWAELIWNDASLLGRQTVSVLLYIWSCWEHIEN